MIKWKKNLTPPLGRLRTNIQYVISSNETLTVLVHKLSINVFFCLLHYNVHKSVQASEDACVSFSCVWVRFKSWDPEKTYLCSSHLNSISRPLVFQVPTVVHCVWKSWDDGERRDVARKRRRTFKKSDGVVFFPSVAIFLLKLLLVYIYIVCVCL